MEHRRAKDSWLQRLSPLDQGESGSEASSTGMHNLPRTSSHVHALIKSSIKNVIELLPLFEHDRFDLTGEYPETFDYVRSLLLGKSFDPH